VIAALVVACHGGGEPQKPKDRPCATVAHHMLDLMTAQDAPPETTKSINDLIVKRCEQDAWSPEAQQCLLAMKTIDDQAPCAEQMTVRQREALAAGIDELFPKKTPAE
jgi:hypothetical protein